MSDGTEGRKEGLQSVLPDVLQSLKEPRRVRAASLRAATALRAADAPAVWGCRDEHDRAADHAARDRRSRRGLGSGARRAVHRRGGRRALHARAAPRRRVLSRRRLRALSRDGGPAAPLGVLAGARPAFDGAPSRWAPRPLSDLRLPSAASDGRAAAHAPARPSEPDRERLVGLPHLRPPAPAGQEALLLSWLLARARAADRDGRRRDLHACSAARVPPLHELTTRGLHEPPGRPRSRSCRDARPTPAPRPAAPRSSRRGHAVRTTRER